MSAYEKKSEALDRQARDAQEASAIMADVGREQVAAVYAEAFLGAAQNAGRPEALIEEFDSFLTDVLDRLPEFEKVLESGFVGSEEKNAILDRALAGQASPEFLNFLKVVSRRGRLDLLRAIQREVHKLFERMQGRVRVQITTATPLDDQLANRIAENLRRMLQGEAVLQQAVDPALIGGIVVRVGDTVYDGSIATQLQNVRQQMIDRSAHEIQSRRDRFRYPD